MPLMMSCDNASQRKLINDASKSTLGEVANEYSMVLAPPLQKKTRNSDRYSDYHLNSRGELKGYRALRSIGNISLVSPCPAQGDD